ncbi:5'-3' exonuclease PLD3-like isoform X2 [Eriocheir sinensis]|uniref:5'-3' exonuclease PLD3-like isoform X2 n=1 Tax=Eriocheir sinensis TaxID=95602 RepID=UPI0021C72FAF|nr:5'-3' exonuclease PLD3-like isoform X2 [Eriocheir sinensis]
MKYTPGSSKGGAEEGGWTGKEGEKAGEREDMLKTPQTVVEGNGKLDFGEYELELWDLRYNGIMGRSKRGGSGSSGGGGGGVRAGGLWEWVRPSCVPITIIVTLSLLIVVMALLDDSLSRSTDGAFVNDQCRFQLVESIPDNLTYPHGSPSHPSTYEAWVTLLGAARESVDIAAFYWTLLNDDVSPKPFPSSALGEDVFRRLKETGLKEGVKMRIAQNMPSRVSPQNDSATLAALGAAEVRSLDFPRLMSGGGVLHTKMWLVDGRHLYLGSANMDWRSLTQVKELGIVIYNCSSLASDMMKIFEVYWQLGKEGAVIPPSWPAPLETIYNINNQMPLSLSGTPVNTYLASSPPPFCPGGRSGDVDAIVDVINKASVFVYVAVMDYFPKTLYSKDTMFWPVLDDAMRRAAVERRVRVRVLASHWTHTRPDLPHFLRSLADISSNHTHVDIQAKLFVVPAFNKEQRNVPFGRVNHNKYMVTDKAAYIGTSNWSADYFINTGGIGLVINETVTTTTTRGRGMNEEEEEEEEENMRRRRRRGQPENREPGQSSGDGDDGDDGVSARQQLQGVFERDWNSEYARPIEEFL